VYEACKGPLGTSRVWRKVDLIELIINLLNKSDLCNYGSLVTMKINGILDWVVEKLEKMSPSWAIKE